VDQRLVTELIPAVAAVAAMAAAIFSYMGVRQARRTQQSTVYLSMAAQYDSEEMRKACNHLLAWRRAHGERFEQIWSDQMATREVGAAETNTARRIVSRYFLNLAKLRRINAVDPESARLLADCYGLNVFYQIVVPLNLRLAANAGDFNKLTNELRLIRREYAGGELIDYF
jgi:hypothetical protein